jgi:hypothetical protein
MTIIYTLHQSDMGCASQIPIGREIYAFEKLTFEYPSKIKSSLSSKPLDLHWRTFDMTMTYMVPQTDMSFVSQFPTDRVIYAFEKMTFVYPWKI